MPFLALHRPAPAPGREVLTPGPGAPQASAHRESGKMSSLKLPSEASAPDDGRNAGMATIGRDVPPSAPARREEQSHR
jgi:hypothetical protein